MTLFINGVERGKAIIVTKTADETVNNSTTLQNDDELLYALEANSTYIITAVIRYDGGTASDFKTSYTIPSGAGSVANLPHREPSAGGNTLFVNTGEGEATSIRVGNDSVDHLVVFNFVVVVAATAGNFQFQWAQNSQVAEDTKVLAGSSLVIRKVT